MKTVNIFQYNISNPPFEFNNNKCLINTLNAYSFVIAEQNKEFKKALQSSDILLPDGFPIVKAVKLLRKEKVLKIAGADIHKYLLESANNKNQKVFYLGSSNKTLQKIRERINNEYPSIKFSSFSPPYKQKFSDEDNKLMIEAVNAVNPDVLFIGMTAPKQEMWASLHKKELNVNIICCIGAVFDFYAGTVRRAPDRLIKFKLEWFYRLVKEPKRMWKRYLIYSPKFYWYLFLAVIGLKKY